MELVITMSAVSVAAFLVTLSRVVGWRLILKHATIVDVVFTIGIGVAFMGTLTGMLVAVLGGLLMALTLTCIKRVVNVAAPLADHVKQVKHTKQGMGRKPVVLPEGADLSEYTADGKWIYNEAPYA